MFKLGALHRGTILVALKMFIPHLLTFVFVLFFTLEHGHLLHTTHVVASTKKPRN